MSERASPTAIIALCISIGTAGFSAFQWWNNERAARINSAIDISKYYMKEKNTEVAAHVYWAARGEIGEKEKEKFRKENRDGVARHYNFLYYVALLSDTDTISKDHLWIELQCDVFHADRAAPRIGEIIDVPMSPMGRFVDGLEFKCNK